MRLGADGYKDRLIEKWLYWDERDDRSVRAIACIARDEKRAIEQQFKNVFHKPIDIEIKKRYNKV